VTQPALTPEEWARLLRVPDWDDRPPVPIVPAAFDYYERACRDLSDLHRIAAEVLHGQPFGFDWADVDGLRILAPELWDLADRIAALLPPRE